MDDLFYFYYFFDIILSWSVYTYALPLVHWMGNFHFWNYCSIDVQSSRFSYHSSFILSREWFLVLIRTQELKLRKNFVQFKYSLCVSKKTILDGYCSYVELFTTRLIKLVSKWPVTPWSMHSVAGNVLFYNSWERVSDFKITELNIS